VNQLPIFLNLRGVPVILLGDGEMADAKRRLIERSGGICVEDGNQAARIAIVALEDEAEAIAAVERLKQRGLLVNAVDRPSLCDFTTPAIIDRDPVLVAIGTGGASAGLAKALRQRIEGFLPAGLGRLARELDSARHAVRARWPSGPDRRRAIDAALAPGGMLDLFCDHPDMAVQDWLAKGGSGQASGVYELAIRSCDPDELTLRQVRLLGSADLVLHPEDMPRAVLARARADAAMRIDTGGDASGADGVIVRLVWAKTAGSS
jgi:uroporphyrin-III C-methyltransferase/precorrin-2 dehydrogenase/sirohydrochlorin ferrochelatase